MVDPKPIYAAQPLAAWNQILLNGIPVAWTHKKDDAYMLARCLNEREELVKALERYATHASDCSVRQALGIRCDCGLSDVFQRYVLKTRGTS